MDVSPDYASMVSHIAESCQMSAYHSAPGDSGLLAYNVAGYRFDTVVALVDEKNSEYYFGNAHPALNQLSQKQPSKPSEPVALTVAEMVAEIQSVFGLNVSQLADILRLSRATIYNHLADKEPENDDDYLKLYRLAKRAEAIRSTYAGSLKNVLVDGKTLLKHLKSSWEDSDAMLRVCAVINEKVSTQKPHKAERENQILATRRISRSG